MKEGDGFEGYATTTINTGSELLAGTVLLLILLALLFMCMVTIGKQTINTLEEQEPQLESSRREIALATHGGSPTNNDENEIDTIGVETRQTAVDEKLETETSWQPRRGSILRTVWGRLVIISACDDEAKQLCKISVPFVGQALVQGIMGGLRVGIIGRFVGTNALLAYLTVDLLVGLTTSLLGGFQEALSALCSHGLGNGSSTLAGQYAQIATTLYILFYLPFFALWAVTTGPIVTWLGFDLNVRVIAEDFVLYYLFAKLVVGVHKSVRSVLNVIDKEVCATLSFLGTEMFNAVGLLVVVVRFPSESSLVLVGMVYILVETIAVFVHVALISRKGWFDPLLRGMVGSFALSNTRATITLIGTASSLAVGEFLAYSEWELLTVFASFLGPAEVAAWGLLGTIWSGLELIIEAVANAAEVRVSFLLGSSCPDKAKLSAYKTMFLALLTSCLTSSVLFIGGKSIPRLLTNDPILQSMTTDALPLLGIGNIALSFGAVSWTMIGAQGRYRLSTVIGFSGSLLVAVPLACISSIGLNLDLQGQTAALIIGSFVSGIVNAYVLFQSDWHQLSWNVIQVVDSANAANTNNTPARQRGPQADPDAIPGHMSDEFEDHTSLIPLSPRIVNATTDF